MSENPLPPLAPVSAPTPTPHRRRPRYRGTHPRRFEEKYKEHDPGRYADTVAKVLAAGKTPAGTHRPIMVAEILAVLAPQPGEIAVDCTLGYGGHAQEILARIQPGGRLLGLDADPIELPKTEDGSFSDFPSDPELVNFDPSDRKFVAAARNSGARVVNSTDPDWLEHKAALNRNGVQIEFVCTEDRQSW